MPDKAIVDGTKYRVALELAMTIAKNEQPQQVEPREYFLRLYRQCIETVAGNRTVDSIVSGGKQSQFGVALRN